MVEKIVFLLVHSKKSTHILKCLECTEGYISFAAIAFSNEMEKKPGYYTYFSIEFGKVTFQD